MAKSGEGVRPDQISYDLSRKCKLLEPRAKGKDKCRAVP